MASRNATPSIATLALLGMLASGGVLAVGMLVMGSGPAQHDPDGRGSDGSDATSATAKAPSEDAFAFWGVTRTGEPLRWDACAPVTFVLSASAAPDHARTDLSTALAVLADASGLDLRLVGTTEERPRLDRPLVERDGDGWRWKPVLVAWAEPGEGDLPLSVHDRGVALPVAVRAAGRETFVTGQVIMNASRTDLVPGFDDRIDAVGATLLHELGHLLGLAHVDDTAEIMSADPGSGPVRLGPGDRAGLRAIGSEAGCAPAPPPTAGRGLVGIP